LVDRRDIEAVDGGVIAVVARMLDPVFCHALFDGKILQIHLRLFRLLCGVYRVAMEWL